MFVEFVLWIVRSEDKKRVRLRMFEALADEPDSELLPV